MENSQTSFHTATPRGPSPIFLIRPNPRRRRKARCAWVLEIPARWARSRRGKATSPEGEAERARAPKTLEAEGGSLRRTSGQKKTGPVACPQWALFERLRGRAGYLQC